MNAEKSQMTSIAQALREETIVTESSISDIQEDFREAEKERLLSGQKRKDLLESLRKSVGRVHTPRHNPLTQRDEFVRLIRDGVSSEVEAELGQIQRNLKP